MILDWTEHADYILSGQRKEAFYFGCLVKLFPWVTSFLLEVQSCLNMIQYMKELGGRTCPKRWVYIHHAMLET